MRVFHGGAESADDEGAASALRRLGEALPGLSPRALVREDGLDHHSGQYLAISKDIKSKIIDESASSPSRPVSAKGWPNAWRPLSPQERPQSGRDVGEDYGSTEALCRPGRAGL